MKRLLSPIDVQIEITAQCNQNCVHCYNYWRGDGISQSNEMSSEALQYVLKKLADAKVTQITFTGGEPLLRPKVLMSSLREAQKLGLSTSLNSNAVLLTDDVANELSQSGIQHVLVSISGPPSVHNKIGGDAASFDKTMEGITSLIRHNVPTSSNMVVSKLNLDVMFETARLIKSMGVQTFCAGPMVPSCHENIAMCLNVDECKQCLDCLLRIENELGLNIDILEPLPRCMFTREDDLKYARFFGNRVCSAGVTTCAISATGDIRPCIQSDVIYGNLLREEFLTIWDKMSDWADIKILPDECSSCLAINICEGGCRMSAKITSGRYNGRDMYMSNPIIDHDRLCVVKCDKRVGHETLTIDDTFNVSRRCVIRREVDSVLILLGSRYERLSRAGFDFLETLMGRNDFTAREIAETVNCNAVDILQVFDRLLISGILQKKCRKETTDHEDKSDR